MKTAPKVQRNDLTMWEDPLNDIDLDVLKAALIQEAKKAIDRKIVTLTRLQKYVRDFDSIHLLSTVGFTCTVNFGGNKYDSDWQKPQQGMVEFIQALCLTAPLNKTELAGPTEMQNILDDLKEYFSDLHSERFVQLDGNPNQEDLNKIRTREHVRLHTELVRNWGYPEHVKSILRELYGNFELGPEFNISALISLFEYLMYEMEERLNSYIQQMRRTFSSSSRKRMVYTYHKEFGLDDSSANKFWEMMKTQKASREKVTSILLSHSGLILPDIYTFTLDEISKSISIPKKPLAEVIKELSYKEGDLVDANVNHFHLNNPIWKKPIIAIDSNTIFCPIPMVFFGQSIPLIENLLVQNSIKPEKISKERSKFLEKKVAGLFSSFFDDCKIYENVKWRLKDREYETDLLIRIDCYLFIVEIKSGRITAPALRGADNRIERHIKELFVAPSVQSSRLLEQLTSKRPDPNFELMTDLDMSTVRVTQRLSVTMEDFATIQTNVAQYSDDDILPPTIAIADLMVLLDVLNSPWMLLHYLTRRDSIQQKIKFTADEMDLLGLYLDSGFYLPQFENTDKHIIATGISARIDDYYSAKDQKQSPALPKRKLSKWFEDVIADAYERRFYGWSEILTALLDLNHHDQKKVERWFFKLKRKLKNSTQPLSDIQNTLVYVPDGADKQVYAFLVLRPVDYDDRDRICEDAAMQAFDMSEAGKCVLVALKTEGTESAYSRIGMYERPK